MNVLTVKKKLFICEVTIYIYEMERQERLTRFGTYQRSKRVCQGSWSGWSGKWSQWSQ